MDSSTLTRSERLAIAETPGVAGFVQEYKAERQKFASTGISLGRYMRTRMRDRGDFNHFTVPPGEDALSYGWRELKSALAKLDAEFPMPTHPLASV